MRHLLSGVEELSLLKRGVGVAADDDVVEDVDAEDPAGLDEPARDGKVFLRRRGIPGGMVMRQDQRGSRDGDRRLVNLARMDDRGVEAPDRDDFPPKNLVAGIEVEADEVLAVGCPDVPAEV